MSSNRLSRKPTSSRIVESADSIRVVCRFRPYKPNQEDDIRNANLLTIDDEGKSVTLNVDNYDTKKFTFDKIMGMKTTQATVFSEVEGVIDSVMSGFNGTVLAYGQTSAGKSWTMEGPDHYDPDLKGVIPRSIERLFNAISNAAATIRFTVQLSYYEIYCERVRDLLNPLLDNLKLRETKEEGFIIPEITEIFCVDEETVFQTLAIGKSNRASAPTLMNAESSRSHSILSLILGQTDEVSGRSKRSRLFLVDLAGSEKVSKSGASGIRLEEAKKINLSLTTLGMVINSLCDGSPHVPYRDSRLTRLLMESLGGNSKTTMIICCAPERSHLHETISTLRFGERAKKIQNHAKVNEELSRAELTILLEEARKEIQSLKLQLSKVIPSMGDPNTSEAQNSDMKVIEKEVFRVDENKEKEYQKLKLQNKEHLLEIQMLKERISDLEDELDQERRRVLEEREARDDALTEANALRESVHELEVKLLKLSIDARPRSRTTSSAANESIEYTKERPMNPVTPTIETPAKHLDALLTPRHLSSFGDMSESEIVQIDDQAQGLRRLLDQEIKELDSLFSLDSYQNSKKEVNDNFKASNFATRYSRLRADYEKYMQRIMTKLTEEQQLRTHVEDRLEEALEKLWTSQTNESQSSADRSGFQNLFKIFRKEKQQTPRRKSDSFQFSAYDTPVLEQSRSATPLLSANSRMLLSTKSMSPQEASLSDALEIAQNKAAQLSAEIEALKESHAIVLETKESVVRSLIKQNAQLSRQHEEHVKRVEELSTTVDTLTKLLKNVQKRNSISGNKIQSHVLRDNTIHGGKKIDYDDDI